MTRRRRAAALLGLALLLGVLAASDVAGREAALRRQLGPTVPVVVVRTPLRAGERIARGALAVRQVPERYAPAGALHDPRGAVGQRVAVAITERTDLAAPLLAVPDAAREPRGPVLRRGERALDLLAVGAADAIVAGARVDVLVTYDGRASAPGPTRLALADVEVLAARAPPTADAPDAAGGLPRLLATLRVTVRQAVALTAAAAAARQVRLLPRP
ncbi:MAG TPA: RcpC/CpaB family pilus assembly protein [Solirubrobacteraceae bacterium]